MEEIETIIKAIAGLPNMAIWALVIFYGYKVAVIGSIYGVIRFVVQKLHDVAVFRRTPAPKELPPLPAAVVIDGITIAEAKEDLLAQLRRVAGRSVACRSDYIHKSSVLWLAQAIDLKIAQEQVETTLQKAKM